MTGMISIGEPSDGCSELQPHSLPTDNIASVYLHEFIVLTSDNCANSAKAKNVYDMGG
jgi:hypothetical protein